MCLETAPTVILSLIIAYSRSNTHIKSIINMVGTENIFIKKIKIKNKKNNNNLFSKELMALKSSDEKASPLFNGNKVLVA